MKQDTKAKIISEATKLFAKNGFEATSMALIAKKVGIEKASLYYFFSDKNELFGAVLEDLWLKAARVVEENPELSRQDFPKYLTEILKIYLKAGLIVLKLDRPKTKHITGYHNAEKQVEFLRTLLRQFLEREKISEVDAAEALVVHSIQGYVIQYQLKKSKVNPKDYAKFISKLILKK